MSSLVLAMYPFTTASYIFSFMLLNRLLFIPKLYKSTLPISRSLKILLHLLNKDFEYYLVFYQLVD